MNTALHILNTKTHLLNSGLCLLLLLGVCLYIFYVSAAVNEVVLRKEYTRSISDARSQIATLESAYIEAQHAVSQRIASAAEYQVAGEKYFVSRGEPSLVLSSDAGN